jgi:hypothetical protein
MLRMKLRVLMLLWEDFRKVMMSNICRRRWMV